MFKVINKSLYNPINVFTFVMIFLKESKINDISIQKLKANYTRQQWRLNLQYSYYK